MLECLPCIDSEERAASLREELFLPRELAAARGRAVVEALERGGYETPSGRRVEWGDLVHAAVAAKVSIPPEAPLPEPPGPRFPVTRVRVMNETTLRAARALVEEGKRVLALNMANGIHPGGGFLGGARAQEESLCRASALFATLVGDPMYEAHRALEPEERRAESSDRAILSPRVPVFREDDGTVLEEPWRLDFLTCAAPVARVVGQPRAGDLLARRIHRVLAIARAYGYPVLVVGAWGCGAFRNDPGRTARDFRRALETDFAGAFAEIVFAITDWSPERRFLGPFRDAFQGRRKDTTTGA